MKSLLLALLCCVASAQTASLSGLVTDESGAILQSATVRLTGPAGLNQTAATNQTGSYSFLNLRSGNYSLTATAPGLATPTPIKTVLRTAPVTLNLQLKVALVTQKLQVDEDVAPTVRTGAAENASATIIKGDDLAALADNPDDLAADLQALAGPTMGPNGDSILIDGFSGGQLPPKESIREVRINSNPFSPEYDKIGFGRVEIFTKPGARIFRGNVDYNFANQFWNSRNPYSTIKAPMRLHELEGGGTGPLGKRASFTIDGLRNSVDNGSIVNAVTLAPQTQRPTSFTEIFTTPQRMLKLSPRVDYQINDNHVASLRYTFTKAKIDGSGIGSFDLTERGYRLDYTHQTLQFTETAILGEKIFETRFQYYRTANQITPRSSGPALDVLGSFNSGGVPTGNARDNQNNLELHNLLTFVKGRHFWRFGTRLRSQQDDNIAPNNFGGTYSFGGGLAPILDANDQPLPSGAQAQINSIERYRRTLAYLSAGLPSARIRALGGGATQFTLNAGNPALNVRQFDAGFFAGDEWRLRPNLTINLGLRYELQSNISDWGNVAPRVALAWAPAKGKEKPKSVFRAGGGFFYDRFALANTLTAQRYNGQVQQQYVISNPDFYPAIPNPAALSGFRSSQITQVVSADMKALQLFQTAYSWERQLPRNTTMALTYSMARGTHMFRSRSLPGPIYLMESSGVYRQNQMVVNVTTKATKDISLFGFYVLNKARSNTDGIGTFPARQFDYTGEYGPASTDIRHRVTFGGTLNLPYAVRFSPMVVLQSGQPFDITTGSDLYGTTLFNARPSIASDATRPGLITTQYGVLNPSPLPGETLLNRNYGRGPGQYNVNLRMAKTIGFGPEKGGAPKGAMTTTTTGTAVAGPGATATAPGGGRAVAGAATVNRRYNLIVSMSVRNLLNHNNPGPITGNITSPLFGRANRVAGTVNGEGFSENASNRRLELQMRLNF